MIKMAGLICIAIMLGTAHTGFTQESSEFGVLAPAVKNHYKPGDPRPLGMDFFALVTHIALHARDDHPRAVGMVRYSMRLDNDTAAGFMLERFMETWQSMEDDAVSDRRKLVCPSDRTLPSGDALYAAFDALDGARTASAARQLALLRAELSREQNKNLTAWIADATSGSTVVVFDHKKRYEIGSQRAEDTRDRICERIAATQPAER